MRNVTKDQIAKSKEMDLLTYLELYEPNNLVKKGRDYTIKEHHSMSISENGLWRWCSRDIGGKTALKYLIDVKGMKFVDAVIMLCNEPVQVLELTVPKKGRKKNAFRLPAPYHNNNRLINYLKSRGISYNIIKYCIDNKLIYESKDYHNAVFVGYDGKGTPRYAALRGTWQTDESFKSEVSGSDKRYCFCIKPKGHSDKLIIAESAIDALSVACLRDKWFDGHYLSVGGVYAPKKEHTRAKLPRALEQYLKDHKEIIYTTLCLDNDDIGRGASRFIIRKLFEKGYIVADRPPRIGKDWNENLVFERSSIWQTSTRCGDYLQKGS